MKKNHQKTDPGSKSHSEFEAPLRPHHLDEFVGQGQVRRQLEISTKAARDRSEALGHCLLVGPPGLGKTTLAHIIAQKMEGAITITSGASIDKAGDLAGLLTHMQKGGVLFIDEIHRLNITIEEYLYPAMENFTLDVMIDTGPNARSMQLPLQPFTLIGATTRMGLISNPMRSRFSLNCRLEYYATEELAQILRRSSKILEIELQEGAAMELASRARGTPRIVNNLLRWVRDYAQVKSRTIIDVDIVRQALEVLSIDHMGLDMIDQRILRTLIEHYQGGPVGIKAIAAVLGEEASTLEEVYEPYLVLKGLIRRTPRGREATERAYQHLHHYEA